MDGVFTHIIALRHGSHGCQLWIAGAVTLLGTTGLFREALRTLSGYR
jgi:hypothetical protein